MRVIVIFSDRVGDGLEEHGLTSFRRRDNQTTLSTSNGGDEVNDTTRDIRGTGFEIEHLAGDDWSEDIKVGTTLSNFRVYTVNGFDAQQAIVLFVILRRSHLARNHVAGA